MLLPPYFGLFYCYLSQYTYIIVLVVVLSNSAES